MASDHHQEILCRLKALRIQKKMTQAGLAEVVGIKRQAVYDIEAGKYLPNTAVALAMARVLGCRVEDIFSEAMAETQAITLVDGETGWGKRVNIARVRDRLFAYPLAGPHARLEDLGAADGLLEPGESKARLLMPSERLAHTALLLGCDPAFSVLAHRVREAPGQACLNVRFASSRKALTRLGMGQAHIAGTHMHGRDGNRELVRQAMPGISCILVGFSSFEEGLIVAKGNPKGIRDLADLAREDIRFVNRERGAALRSLLDEMLRDQGVDPSAIAGYDTIVKSHGLGAQAVLYNNGDAALGLKSVAVSHDLDFIPFSRVRCDLVIPSDLMDHSGVRLVLDIIQTRAFREELACIPGYETSATGSIVAEI